MSRQATLICGPPGSGKTTYATSKMRRGDLVLDMDFLYSALSCRPLWDKPTNLFPLVRAAWDAVVERAARHHDLTIWAVACAPRALERRTLAAKLNATTIVLAVDPLECRRRMQKQGRKGIDSLSTLVAEWWSSYESIEGEMVITS